VIDLQIKMLIELHTHTEKINISFFVFLFPISRLPPGVKGKRKKSQTRKKQNKTKNCTKGRESRKGVNNKFYQTSRNQLKKQEKDKDKKLKTPLWQKNPQQQQQQFTLIRKLGAGNCNLTFFQESRTKNNLKKIPPKKQPTCLGW
jgi:hypothetical protein